VTHVKSNDNVTEGASFYQKKMLPKDQLLSIYGKIPLLDRRIGATLESDPERRNEWLNSRAGTEQSLPFYLPCWQPQSDKLKIWINQEA